jgi:hypothetical protein
VVICIPNRIHSIFLFLTTKLGDAIKFLCYNNETQEKYNKKLQWVKFLIKNGGDLNNCDTFGRNYVDFLNEYYTTKEIDEMGVVKIIEQLKIASI